jgi:hypothetical protein
MSNRTQPLDKQVELIPDFPYESRREFVERLAFKLWVERGSPHGSPEIDWFAAERAVYNSMESSGMINPYSNADGDLERAIYR